MNTIQECKKLVSATYGGISIPSIYSPGFMSLIKGTLGLANDTVKVNGSLDSIKSLKVTFAAGSSASTDKYFNVMIPAWYCFKSALSKYAQKELSDHDAKIMSLIMMNGSSIHEGLHVAHSKSLLNNLEQICKTVVDQQLMKYCLNIVEDLKNEAICERYPSLFEFVNLKNELLFSQGLFQEVISESIKKYNGTASAAAKVALEILPFFKCKSRRESLITFLNENYLSEVVDLLNRSAREGVDTVYMATRLYNYFFKENENGSDSSPESDEGEDGESMDKPKKNEKFSAERSTLERMMKEAGEVGQAECENEFNSPQMDIEVSGNVPSVIERDITTLSFGCEVEKSQLNFDFVKSLKVSRQIVPSLGEPKTKGSLLVNTRLSRIATDGKIFAKRGESFSTSQRKQPVFTILVDASGSMRGLFKTVLSTVEVMANAMVQSGISFTVVAHTSIEEAEDVPIVYHIFTNKVNGKTSVNMKERFEKAAGLHLQENFDGYAIDHCKKFFGKNEANIMVVLSDGLPCAPNYDSGVKHTKTIIEKMRKSGVKVISISLKHDVLSDNNRLYGEKYNIDGTSQRKLEEGMKRVILGG